MTPNIDHIREGFQTADEVYAEAMKASPFKLADKLLGYAYRERDAEKRATLRQAAVHLIRMAVKP